MERTCNNCKALQKNYSGVGYHCQLNHIIMVVTQIDGIPVSYKPLEECKKHPTNMECANHFSNANKLN